VILELRSVWVTAPRRAPLPGYVCVVAKRHVEEPFELVGSDHRRFWEESMHVAEALANFVRPKKMNYEIHGNTIPHLHLHLFPRFEGDPFAGKPIDGQELTFTRSEGDLRALAEAIAG
jgi:diadenosine tetraphosphate (Ap4A) HIT family hydrolase